MLEFQYDRKKYKLPQSWGEVTFRQLKQIMKLYRQELPNLERTARVVSILSGIPYGELTSAEPKLTMTLLGHLSFLDDECKKVREHFKIGKDVFIVSSLEESIFREYIIFDKINNDFKQEPEEGYALTLALLCRKKGESFKDIENILDERAKLFEENLNAGTVLDIVGFFLTKKQALSLSLNLYSKQVEQVQQMQNELQGLLSESTGIRRLLIGWQVRCITWITSMIRKHFKR